jgi:hypothetical protein
LGKVIVIFAELVARVFFGVEEQLAGQQLEGHAGK